MDMKRKDQIQTKLKQELQTLSSNQISDSDAHDAFFNLSGFLKIINKMKKEAQNGAL